MTNCCEKSKTIKENVNIYPSNFYVPSIDHESKKLDNRIRTTKYRFYNFIFLNLFEQFKRYSNLFFIFCVVLNFIPEVGAFNQGTAIIPILFILIVTLIKDGIEDLRRYFSDRNVNNRPVLRYNEFTNEFSPCKWKDVRVGDMIKLSACERIPADLLIYYSSDPTGMCFIETMDIDGETTLKQRFIIKSLDNNLTNSEDIFKNYYFEAEAPNEQIYKFNGKIFDYRIGKSVLHLNCTNLILRDTILRNTDEVRGIVIYAGNQTKVFMNNKKARFKRSLLEDQLNVNMLMCLGILIIVCMMTGIGCSFYLRGFSNVQNVIYITSNSTVIYDAYLQGFIQFWTSVIVFQSIIPIALYITLELVKAHQILHITNDLALYNESMDKKIDVKAYNITEDLGQIKHMFCDKTGTLTDNEMIFRNASIFGRNYKTEENDLKLSCVGENEDLYKNSHVLQLLLLSAICNTTIIAKSITREKKLVHVDTCSTSLTNATSTGVKIQPFFDYEVSLPIESILPVSIEDTDPIPKDLTKREFEKAESLQSTCSYSKSNVTANNYPPRRLTNEELSPLLLSESPDEDALVRMVMYNGYALHQRTSDKLIIWDDVKRKWIIYEILKTLPFDSIRKCMSVIVKDNVTGEISLNCKGADSVMFHKMVADSETDLEVIEKTKADLYTFASNGLRTLVMGKRILNENEFKKWEEMLTKVEDKLINNEKEIKELYDLIESNLDLVGAIGLEDKLQEFVPEILECFKEAGINIWILTGDKKETAISIAYSSRLFSKNETVKEISCEIEAEIVNVMSQIREDIEKSLFNRKRQHNAKTCKHEEFVLVIDGSSLSTILSSDELRDEFLHIAYFCNCVVCCRCTPIQKGEVVSLVKKYYKVRTLAIGDGANDVNMIQTADIGIGVSGKEGSQATLASDFAITKFKYLKRLVLVHGHWSYDKLARMSLIMFYKNMIISLVMFFYQILCGFSNSRAIDQVTQLIFHLIHTGLPPIIFGVWDKDFSDEILLANPQIYLTGINSKMYRPRDFWRTISDAIWQALVIFIVPSLCYWDTEISMGEFGIISVSCVVIAMFSHILIESRHWSVFHWVICIGSLGIGFYLELFIINVLCVVLFDCNTDNPYKVLHYTMSRGKTYLIIGLTTAICLFPRLLVKGILMESRDSVFYEAHRRISKLGIRKWTTNISETRKYDPNIFDYRNSKFYLGDLEEFKKIKCDKCEFRDKFLDKQYPFSFAKYRKNQVLPLII